MQTYQDSIEDLSKCTVAIQEAGENGRILGTGVIVTYDGLILTCYHVVGNIKTKTLDKTVDIYFPEIKSIKQADIVEEYCNPSLDIAFLKLKEALKLPDKIAVANLGETVSFGHKFASIGFRKSNMFEKLSSGGEIRIKTSYKTKKGNESLSLVQLHSDEIEKGMSGAPVLDLDTNKVIGIISDHYHTEGNVDAKLNFAIPVEAVLKLPKVESALKEKNSGLKLIFEFLRKIGAEEIEKYHRINDLFVPPTEYEQIRDILRKHRIVFITGTKEYGKTYTAIRLLWEYFNKGYEPKWYSIEQEKIKGSDIRNRMLKIKNLLKEHHIILFDDPFGKTQYEGNEELERSIRTIIDAVENTEDAYVIITSREEIFKEFVRITGYDPKNVEVKMNLKTPSYDYEKRKEMLLKWAEVYNCKWLGDEGLKTIVLEAIKDKIKLPTSLNIQTFAYATKNITTEKEIFEKIEEKSQETAWSFANEIKNMADDKILFLSFPFISNRFSVDFIKAKYQELINELYIKKGAWSFERVLYHFKDDKIDISYKALIEKNLVGFSHPSYSEALPHLLLENGFPTEINTRIFSNVLIKLSNIEWEALKVADFVARNFDKLPEDAQSLLFKIADNKNIADVVAYAVANNFDKLPPNVRDLLFVLADRDDVHHMAYALDKTRHNCSVPDDIREQLLNRLADRGTEASSIARVIFDNYNNLSYRIWNLLFKCAESEEPWDFASIVIDNFDKIPQDIGEKLLFKMTYNIKLIRDLGYVIPPNLDKLPQGIGEKLLNRLADRDEAAESIAVSIIRNFDKIPQDIGEKLLFKTFERADPTSLFTIATHNFDKLSDNVKNLLFKLIANINAHSISIIEPLFELPQGIGEKLLNRLADRDEAAEWIARSIIHNFDKLSDNVKNLLFKLADRDEAARRLAYVIPPNLDKLPQGIGEKLLNRLADRDEAARRQLAYTMIGSYNKLSDNGRNLLFKLAETKDTANAMAMPITIHYDKYPLKDILLKIVEIEEVARKVKSLMDIRIDKIPDNLRSEILKKINRNKMLSS